MKKCLMENQALFTVEGIAPHMPCEPSYNLHEMQVGRRPAASLLPTSSRLRPKREGEGGLQFTAGEGHPL